MLISGTPLPVPRMVGRWLPGAEGSARICDQACGLLSGLLRAKATAQCTVRGKPRAGLNATRWRFLFFFIRSSRCDQHTPCPCTARVITSGQAGIPNAAKAVVLADAAHVHAIIRSLVPSPFAPGCRFAS